MINKETVSVVIVNFQSTDADLLKRIKYNLERTGFSLSEDYTDPTSGDTKNNETLALVYTKTHENA